MPTATHIRKLDHFAGDAALYRLDPPLEGNEFVAVSAVDLHRETWAVNLPEVMKSETYIFPSDGDGFVSDWGELRGSMKGTLSHSEALAKAGYEVAW